MEPDENDLLDQQRRAVEAWLTTPDATTSAERLLRRWSLDGSGDDLVAEAWIRVRESFERRSEPYPDLSGDAEVARFGARILDNLRRDRQRKVARRKEVELVEAMAPAVAHETNAVDSDLLLRALLSAVGRRAETGMTCAGCPGPVAAAMALEVVHLTMAGHDGGERGRDWLDQMLHLALERVDGVRARSVEAWNQRKSRCGRCARDLLLTGARDVWGSST